MPLCSTPLRTTRFWTALALSGALVLGACGGDDGPPASSLEDEDTSVVASDLPALTLAEHSYESIVADARLGRLVHASFGAENQVALDRIQRYFTQQAAFTSAADLRTGDVLVVDGSKVTPNDMGGADQLAASAFAAQVPIIVVGFSDALEEALHALLPTATVTGFNSLALILPPRPGYPWSDGAVVLTSSQGDDTTLTVTRNSLDQFARELRDYRASRDAATSSSSLQKAGSDPGANQCSTNNDPAACNYVKQTTLGRMTITEPFVYTGLNQFTSCMSRDWQPYDTYETWAWSRTYAGYTSYNAAEYFEPQCPQQVWNFYPILYLTYAIDPATNKLTLPSRVLYLAANASLDPRVADKNNNVYGWYQTRHSLEVLPDPAFTTGSDPDASPPKRGLIWLDNTPKTQNNQTTQSDTAGWSLNGKISGGSSGGKPTGGAEFGWSVSYSHTTTNTISDWKLLDNTDPAAGIWRFDFQQASPYPVDDSASADCASMGNFLFTWSGTHCHALPQHVITDKIKDLSFNTAALQGLMVWDLGSDNNGRDTMYLTVNTKSWFDSAGCARLTKKSKQSWPGNNFAPPSYLKDANCAGNQSLPPNSGTWYERARRDFSNKLKINLNLLEIPKD
ncbi:hypothetical protein [Ottowia sp. VDI28]|uniref:hypothetical protein n=1 Tax=Ottowia sp. VDI28 TaxID=3133968 RepID=UPI003C2B0FF6